MSEKKYQNQTWIFEEMGLTDLTIYQFGTEDCPPLLNCGPATHGHYIIHYIKKGKGVLSCGANEHYDVNEGQIFLMCPKHIYTYVADEHNPWSYIWVEFDGLKVPSLIDQANLGFHSPIYTPGSEEFSSMVNDHMLSFVNDHEHPLRLIGNMYMLLDILYRDSPRSQNPKLKNLRDFYIHEAMLYIERNYSKNITIRDLADWCGLEHSYFTKIFKGSLLTTPQKYLMKYRMNEACTLLRDTGMSIGEIAEKVGYPNQLHFSRAFHQVYGIAPSKWKKMTRVSMVEYKSGQHS